MGVAPGEGWGRAGWDCAGRGRAGYKGLLHCCWARPDSSRMSAACSVSSGFEPSVLTQLKVLLKVQRQGKCGVTQSKHQSQSTHQSVHTQIHTQSQSGYQSQSAYQSKSSQILYCTQSHTILTSQLLIIQLINKPFIAVQQSSFKFYINKNHTTYSDIQTQTRYNIIISKHTHTRIIITQTNPVSTSIHSQLMHLK